MYRIARLSYLEVLAFNKESDVVTRLVQWRQLCTIQPAVGWRQKGGAIMAPKNTSTIALLQDTLESLVLWISENYIFTHEGEDQVVIDYLALISIL